MEFTYNKNKNKKPNRTYIFSEGKMTEGVNNLPESVADNPVFQELVNLGAIVIGDEKKSEPDTDQKDEEKQERRRTRKAARKVKEAEEPKLNLESTKEKTEGE